MPGKTQADRLLRLEETVATLNSQVGMAVKAIDELSIQKQFLTDKLVELHRDYYRTIALLNREIEELKKWKDEQKKAVDEHSRRIWAFGPNIAGAVLSALLAAFLTYLIAKR